MAIRWCASAFPQNLGDKTAIGLATNLLQLWRSVAIKLQLIVLPVKKSNQIKTAVWGSPIRIRPFHNSTCSSQCRAWQLSNETSGKSSSAASMQCKTTEAPETKTPLLVALVSPLRCCFLRSFSKCAHLGALLLGLIIATHGEHHEGPLLVALQATKLTQSTGFTP